jgi:hypothetical protein
MRGTGDVIIDTTPITRLPDVHSPDAPLRLTIPGASGGALTQNNQFHVLVQLQHNVDDTPSTSFAVQFSRTVAGGHFVLDTISWNPGTDNLEVLSSNMRLSAEL